MLFQMIIGILIICGTAYIHAWALALAMDKLNPISKWAKEQPTNFRLSSAIGVSVAWVMLAHLVEVAVWAGSLYGFGIFDRLDTSYYFSLVAYTTLGFGDIILPGDWRILSGLIAANGFLIFGWSTAFQVEYLNNLRPDR
ncbi:MAG: ion channel [Pseudomonadota bacterium]